MRVFVVRGLGTLFVAGSLIAGLSCARDQQLQSITLTPNSVKFEGVGAVAQFTAVGHYLHPPQNKDVTGQVIWTTDVPGLVQFSSATPGQATALNVCGFGQVQAVIYSNPSNPPRGSIWMGTADVSGVAEGTPTCQ
jgi:hypothetical protein